MRHGLTLGELGSWFIKTLKLDVDYRVVEMQGWQPDAAPGFGWPLGERAWINPSPNAPNLWMARAYAGTVIGRGHHALGRPRHHAAARIVRRARYRCAGALEGNAHAGAALAPRLPSARVLVRADVSQTCRQAVQWRADPYRRPVLRSRGVQALAYPGAGLQGDPPFVSAIICSGAISPTSTSGKNSPSMSSTAARCCASGWTTRARHRKIWMRWRWRTSGVGRGSGRGTYATELRMGRPRGSARSPCVG